MYKKNKTKNSETPWVITWFGGDTKKGREYKLARISFFFFTMIIILAMASIASSLFFKYRMETTLMSKDYQHIDIELHNLTAEEREITLKMINEIKPIYLKATRTIVISPDVIANDPQIAGQQTLGNDIIVLKYDEMTHRMRNTLCHELLHSFMLRDENTHEVIYDIAEYQPCFESRAERDGYVVFNT